MVCRNLYDDDLSDKLSLWLCVTRATTAPACYSGITHCCYCRCCCCCHCWGQTPNRSALPPWIRAGSWPTPLSGLRNACSMARAETVLSDASAIQLSCTPTHARTDADTHNAMTQYTDTRQISKNTRTQHSIGHSTQHTRLAGPGAKEVRAVLRRAPPILGIPSRRAHPLVRRGVRRHQLKLPAEPIHSARRSCVYARALVCVSVRVLRVYVFVWVPLSVPVFVCCALAAAAHVVGGEAQRAPNNREGVGSQPDRDEVPLRLRADALFN